MQAVGRKSLQAVERLLTWHPSTSTAGSLLILISLKFDNFTIYIYMYMYICNIRSDIDLVPPFMDEYVCIHHYAFTWCGIPQCLVVVYPGRSPPSPLEG
jgi:hypothetical protein